MSLMRIGFVVGAAFAVGAIAVTSGILSSQPAHASGGASGSLGSIGTARGDISLDAGDMDRVTVDLVEGMTFTAKFTSKFSADVTFADPAGAPVNLGWGTGATRTAKPYRVTTSGRYEFTISAAAATQGTYSLTVAGKCPKKVTLRGASGDTVRWGMLRGSSVTGKVLATPARSWSPVLSAVAGPSGPRTTKPVNGAKGLLKLPKISADANGSYSMTITGGAGGGAFSASLLLKLPRIKAANVNLTDGLTPVSYETGGLKSLFVQRCGACHAWVGSGPQVKPHAKAALARILSGNMPQGGPRFKAPEVELVRQWIATGMAP